tara:strand:+ start:12992 stop:14920 length:1929 start_codon:yes stop_codon:yes gene_type:complete
VRNYRAFGELDDPVLTDGDNGFSGVDSYLEAETLKPGFVQLSENMRLDGDRANVRKGWDFLAATASGPLNTFSYSNGVEEVFTTGRYSDPDDGNQDWLVAATKSAALLWNKDNLNGLSVEYYSATVAYTTVDTSAETITISSHKFQVGDTVQVSTTGGLPSGLSASTTYYIIDASSNTIKLATTLANAKAGTAINLTSQGTGNHTIQSVVILAQDPMIVQAFNQVYIMRLDARPLVWDGATAATGTTVDTKFEALSSSASGTGDPFPSTNFGIFMRNRLIGSQPPTTATPTTAKTGAQIIVASSLLTPNNVNSSTSEFYLNFGSADYFVGAVPYLENQLLVFLRNSVHMITNIHSTDISEHYEITREYGCVSPRSITQSGAQTYFLSDMGVMVMTPQSDPGKGMGIVVSKVQGDAMPLSRSIQDQLYDPDTGINQAAVNKSVAAVYNNHLYLAVPMDDDTTPKTVFIYSILQGAWVSKDTYAEGIRNWVELPYGSNPLRSRLFATMPKGWYLMEENAGLDDTGREIGDNSQSGTTAIAGKLKTRNYTFGDPTIKKWRAGQLAANVVNNDAFNVKVNSIDPDVTSPATAYTASGTEEVLVRFGARQRGHSANVEVNVTAGSPSFRHVAIQATGQALSQRRTVA